MAISLKPTLTLESTEGSAGVSEDATLSLSVTDTLVVTDPMVGISRIACTTTGGAASNIILPSVDTTRYLYIKNTGLDGADEATTAHLKVETGDGVRIIDLAADEFCWLPYHAEAAGIVQLEASSTLPDGVTVSSGTIIAEYGYWTKA
jgi:hypothetical protein